MNRQSSLAFWKLTLTMLGTWGVALPVFADEDPQPSATADNLSEVTFERGQPLRLGDQSLGVGPFPNRDLSDLNFQIDRPQTEAPQLRQTPSGVTLFDLRPQSPDSSAQPPGNRRDINAADLLQDAPNSSSTPNLLRDLAEGPPNANPLSPPLPEPTEDNTEVLTPSPLDLEPSPRVIDAELTGVAGPAVEVFPVGEPRIPADDRSRLIIGGRVLDSSGAVLQEDIVVTLTSSDGEFLGADYDPDRAGFQVLARRGEFQVYLKSGLTAQQVRVRAAVDRQALRELDAAVEAEPASESNNTPNADLEAFTTVEFTTHLRPSLVSGVVDIRLGPGGADFWDSFSSFLAPDQIGDTDFDVDAAVFATGALGEWLFTGAFNSDRALNQRCDGTGLYRDVQSCDQTYPVYGDSSTTDFLTPSIDSFYARLQRDADIPGADPDYIMWGDYNTLEFSRASQEFTATARQLHGFKGNYSFGPLQLTAMYANNLQPFQRDIIAPDGTSGFYFLSQRLILPGSEDIYIELEELNRPGTVIERERLRRGIDYEIDYDRGSLLFRQPIRQVEVNPLGQTLVRKIVATYQVDEAGNAGGSLYAGRLQYNFAYGFDQPSWLGATFLTQDEGLQDFTLVGADLMIPLGDEGQLVGEFAHSSLTSPTADLQGEAYRLEASGELFENVLAQAYLRSAGEGFRNTATTSFRPGQTRYGAGFNAGLGPDTRLRVGYDHESNTGVTPQVLTSAAALLNPGQEAVPGAVVDNSLDTLNVGITQQVGTAALALDWVYRDRENRINGFSSSAHQIVPRLAVPLGPDFTFQAQTEINLTSDVDPLYPSRTTFGLDWLVDPDTTIRLAQQFISGGGGQQPGSITSLDMITDYAIADNTYFTSRYSLINGMNGLTGQGAIGLNHRLKLAPGLHANLGFERIFGDVFNQTGAGQQFAQPYAVGSGGTALGYEGGTAYSVGLEYTDNPDFQASARFEHRDSSAGSNTTFGLAAAGKISPALTTLFRYQQGNYANQLITGQLGDTINLRLGLAYRNPVSDQFNGLLSYEFRQNPATTPDTILQGFGGGSSDHTLAMEGIYAPNWRWEFYGKYALRHGNTNVADNFDFASTIHLAQARASYRFAYQWDVLGEVRWIGQPGASFSEVGFAAELGYYLTPDLRLGAGYTFGSANDSSFAGSGYRSASGPYIGITLKVNELFNGFGLQEVAPAQQEESLLESEVSEAAPTVEPDAAPSSETPSETPSEPAAPEADSIVDSIQAWVNRDTSHQAGHQEGERQ